MLPRTEPKSDEPLSRPAFSLVSATSCTGAAPLRPSLPGCKNSPRTEFDFVVAQALLLCTDQVASTLVRPALPRS